MDHFAVGSLCHLKITKVKNVIIKNLRTTACLSYKFVKKVRILDSLGFGPTPWLLELIRLQVNIGGRRQDFQVCVEGLNGVSPEME